MLHAVVIADVVASRSSERLRQSLNEKLRIASIAQLDDRLIRVPYAITAGDEFQVVAAHLDRVPKLILDLRRRLLPFRLRIGIGIGTIEGQIRRPVNRMAGGAFESARKAIIEIKSTRKYPKLTRFHSGRRIFYDVSNLIYGFSYTLLGRTPQKTTEPIPTYLIKNLLDNPSNPLGINTL